MNWLYHYSSTIWATTYWYPPSQNLSIHNSLSLYIYIHIFRYIHSHIGYIYIFIFIRLYRYVYIGTSYIPNRIRGPQPGFFWHETRKMVHQRKLEAARERYGLSPTDEVPEDELKAKANNKKARLHQRWWWKWWWIVFYSVLESFIVFYIIFCSG